MSQATKRKHVVKEVLGDFVTPTEKQQIVKIISSRGNNLHESVTAQGETFLVSMPTKFRKNIWIKRGDYVIVDPIEEGEKVKAEISFILYKHHIHYLQRQKLWPEGFIEDKTSKEQETEDGGEDVSDSEDDESDLFVNTNRCNYQYSESEEEDDNDDDDDDDDDDKDSEEEHEDKDGRTENSS